MCILFIAVEQHPNFPLIIAANRDEYHDRPTRPSQWWEDTPSLLAGKDLRAGGTWMGVTKQGRFAALTNIRNPERVKNNAKSRGELVLKALQTGIEESDLRATKDQYNGYNLLHGHVDDLKVYNNFDDTLTQLKQGVYGLSNAALNSPWPKTTKGMQALSHYCQSSRTIDADKLFQILRDDVKAPDDQLPVTGAPADWEKKLSSAFIVLDHYGTRTSTLLLVSNTKQVYWHERNFNSTAECTNSNNYEFKIDKNVS